MRSRKVTRHYCDHCGRGGFFKSKMAAHELACTANPNRVCRMCGIAGHRQADLKVLQALVPQMTDQDGIWIRDDAEVARQAQQLMEAAHHCPACILAAIRATPMSAEFGFSYEQARKAFWDEHNQPTHYDC